jgi:hypothetical protein
VVVISSRMASVDPGMGVKPISVLHPGVFVNADGAAGGDRRALIFNFPNNHVRRKYRFGPVHER